MDINKLTQKSREAVQDAQALTIEYGNTQIEQAHLLYALLAQENGLIPQMLTKMEIDPEAVKADAQQAVSRLPKVSGPGREPDKVYISQDVDRALNAAQNQADHMTDEYISVEHLMLGLMETADSNLKTIFQRHNLTKEKFLEALKTVRGNTRVTSDTPEDTYDALSKYGQDLVALARAHKLDPVIGRDEEIRNVIRILSRKTKNNPCLIGEPGVGKTAIAEGLAQRIVRGDVPSSLKDRRLFSLDMGALIAAAVLSNRYITDRFLPDKAIDLVDEACAMIRSEMDSMPAEMDELNRKIMRHEIEEAALKKETDTLSQEHLADIQKELADMRAQFSEMKAKWENEKSAIGKVQKQREEIEQLNAEMEKAEREYDLNRAAEIKYGRLPQLRKELEEEERTAEEGKRTLLRDRVTEEEIAKIVARWTGIPVSKLMEGEREKLLHLEDILHQRVIGQDEAVTKVTEAILRSRAGIQDPNRPIGSFLFLGPTGVGKTELAKALAQVLFDDERNMVRIDMTEYMEKYSVSRLIGAPPGYVGYEEGGQLTEAVRKKPYSVVLFDEIEKAHPDVFNILLQVLDDGRITDSQGRTVDFKNTIIILTSNLGSQYILEGIQDGRITDEAREKVEALLKTQFRPEFLNRIDEIVFYKPLMKNEIDRIVDLQIADLRRRLKEKQLDVELTDSARSYIVDAGYDPVYGARPLKRFIQSKVETLIARKILSEDLHHGSVLTVDYDGRDLFVTTK